MNARTYALWLATPLLCLSLLALVLMLYLQPSAGDLTRIGARSERDFGWNQPHAAPQGWDIAVAPERGDAPRGAFDLLVLGDSFSHMMPLNWVQYFVESTGWTGVVYHRNLVPVASLVESGLLDRHRPRVVVVQIVERFLHDALDSGVMACESRSPEALHAGLPLDWVQAPTQALHRKQGLASISTAMSYLIKQRKGRKRVPSQVLTRDDLLSHRRSDTLIYLGSDLDKHEHAPEVLQRMGCGLRNLQQRIESDGQTRFVVMVAPDKSSAYCPYFKQNPDKPVRCESIIEHLAVPGLNLLRLDQDIARALEAGTVDVYLPNDTHWGSAGARIAAESLYRWLTADRLPPVAAPVPEISALD